MKIMLIGGGGREHAIARALAKSEKTEKLYVLPGNAGMDDVAESVGIAATDLPAITEFAVKNGIDYAVVAPDDPLVMGAVDLITSRGIPCFGPTRDAAIIEGSKAFAKGFMARHGIPTAACEVFDDLDSALEYVRSAPLPAVIKADGLALGKGVVIAETLEQAERALCEMMRERRFGDSGLKVVIEEYLEGPEVSVLSFTDGKAVVPMVSSMDHKRALDGDRGLNTGGMGVIAPNPFYTPDVAAECMERIFLPTVRGLAEEGRTFKGCLYFGLMITRDGPKVIEYNCRFGDPETQAVLPLLESDLLEVMLAVTEGRLAETEVRFSSDSSCVVVMASEGYPLSYEKGFPIDIPQSELENVYIAGAKRGEGGELLTNGGRVLGVCGRGAALKAAIDDAYARVSRIGFKNAFYRRDIGARALAAHPEG